MLRIKRYTRWSGGKRKNYKLYNKIFRKNRKNMKRKIIKTEKREKKYFKERKLQLEEEK